MHDSQLVSDLAATWRCAAFISPQPCNDDWIMLRRDIVAVIIIIRPSGFFYPRDAMLARVIEIATCLSVRPSRAGIVSKRRKLAS